MRKWELVWLGCLIVLASWAYYFAFFNYGLTMNDEGFLLENTMRVLSGQVPLRDFYGYAPLRYFYLAGWFEALGANWLVERIGLAFVRTLTPLLLFLVARRFLPPKLALIPTAMVMLAGGPWDKTIDTFLPVFNLWLLVRYLDRSSRWILAACGVSAGVTLFVKQDLGLGTMVAGTLLVLAFGDGREVTREGGLRWDRARLGTLGVYLGGVAAAVAPWLIGYGMMGALRDLVAGLWTPVSVEQVNGYQFLGLWQELDPRHPRAFLQAVLVALSFLTLAVFPLTAWLKWRASGRLSPKLVALWLMAGIAYPIMFVLPGFGRLTQTAPLGYVLALVQVTWLVEWLRGRGGRRAWRMGARACVTGFALVPVAFLLFGLTENDVYYGSAAMRLNRDTLIAPPDARVYVAEEEARAAQEVMAHVRARTAEGDRIFASFDHAFYFLTGRENPTGVYFLPGHLEDHPALLARFLSDLEARPPKVLIRRVYEVGDADLERGWWREYIAREFELAFRNELYAVYDRRGGTED